MTQEQAQIIANFRYGVIAPLVVERLERGEQARILRELAAKEYSIPFSKATGLDKRTLERWLRHYRQGGLEALKPAGRADRGTPRSLPRATLEKTMDLKRELLARSVPQIISMLELAGEVEHGQLKPSTLRRHLSALGIRMPSRESHRRFQSPHRNHTWQGDCHHTLYLPDPENPSRLYCEYVPRNIFTVMFPTALCSGGPRTATNSSGW